MRCKQKIYNCSTRCAAICKGRLGDCGRPNFVWYEFLHVCSGLDEGVEEGGRLVEVVIAQFVGAVFDQMAERGTVGIILGLGEERQIVFQGTESVGAGNRREACGSIGAAVKEDNGGDRGLERGRET